MGDFITTIGCIAEIFDGPHGVSCFCRIQAFGKRDEETIRRG